MTSRAKPSRRDSGFACCASLLPVLLLAFFASCGTGASGPPDEEPEQQPEAVPLDGRGGGVIAYTLQPGSASGLHEIHGINVDGTGDIRLVSASIGLNHQDWSPDARRMVAVGYVDATTWSIYILPLDGSALVRLTNVAGVNDSEPAWSPDGARIAFSRIHPAEGGRSELWLMNADGSGQHSVGVAGFAPRWSPDGTRFVYASDAGGTWDLFVCNTDGTGVSTLLATAAMETNPVWSPAGTEIAYTSDADGDSEIWIMNADGGNIRQVTHNDVDDYAPRWSPSGARLAFDSDLSGAEHWEAYVINADGSNRVRVTHTTPPRTAITATWRPDGGG